MQKTILKIAGVLCTAIALSACNDGSGLHGWKKDAIDWDLNISRKEYKEEMQKQYFDRNLQSRVLGSEDQPLKLVPSVIAPLSPYAGNNNLVSLSVTDDIQIRDVLLELARLANLELVLDPNIRGGVIMKVQDRPVYDVIALLADIASLRYNINKGVLYVQKDTPYLVNYPVDYINLIRSGKGSLNIQTKVLSIDSGASNSSSSSGSSSSSSGSSSSSDSSSDDGGLSSGSSNAISTEYDGDLWLSIEKNIKSILGTIDSNLTSNLPIISAKLGNKNNNSSAVETEDNGTNAALFYALNKQAGVITIMAPYKKQVEIEKYLKEIRDGLSAQVLIEAKLVEVNLNQEYAAGINWAGLRDKNIIQTLNVAPVSLAQDSAFTGILNKDLLSIGVQPHKASNTATTIQFLEGFGTTRVLQNPRVSALNNQQALLTFAVNKPYFTVQGTIQQTTSSTTNNTTTQPIGITSELHTIPIGVILALQPSINLKTNEITMNIRPTISKEIVGGAISDPAVQILSASLGNGQTINSTIPVVEVREMDTVMKIKSGDVMVIGGLIENTNANTDIGVPFLSSIPILGNLVKNVSKTTNIKETVILIQATIINNHYYHERDRQIYNNLIHDQRPLIFHDGPDNVT